MTQAPPLEDQMVDPFNAWKCFLKYTQQTGFLLFEYRFAGVKIARRCFPDEKVMF